jgi:hypothetical protein
MAIEKILLIEDNQKYIEAAILALGNYTPLIASDYNSAIPQIEKVDGVITDLFFPRQQGVKDLSLGYDSIEKIKRGIILPYYQETTKRLNEAGVEISQEIDRAINILGIHAAMRQSTGRINPEMYSEAVIEHLKHYRKDEGKRLLSMLEEGPGNSYKSIVDSYSSSIFDPLLDYMKESPSNQPLGYLVAQETERQKKPFVIATSLSHSNKVLHPILLSAKLRGWPLLEGEDGSKESTKFWNKAYNYLLKGGEQNEENN